jgi:hypothetical protein
MLSTKMAKHEKIIGLVIVIYEFCVKFVGESGECKTEVAYCGRKWREAIFFYCTKLSMRHAAT